MSDLTLFEAIGAQRAIRRFKPDPVPRAAIDRMLEAAIRAPSGRNIQPWRFVVVRDDELRRTLADWYPGRGSWDPAAPSIEDDLAMAPILIVVCFQHTDREAPSIILGASVYPAVQNLMLAATELGLGTTITARLYQRRDDIAKLLGLPDRVEPLLCIPVGYPADGASFGGSRRKPLSEVAFYDVWGRAEP